MAATPTSTAALPPAGDLINVTAYGAVGNGTTDDTAAIQAAALAAAAAGKELYFPSGTYDVSAALQMPSNATWVAAPGTATLLATAGNPLVTAVLTQNDTLSGLNFEGSTTAINASALVIGYKVLGLTLVDTSVENTSGIGVLLSDVNNTTIADSSFSNIGNDPANLSRSQQGLAFTNDAAGYGYGNSVVGSTFHDIGLDAISATGQTGFEAVSNTVTNSPINPGWLQLPAAAAGVYGNQDTGLVVADNAIQGVSGNGIDIANSSNVSVYQNTVTGSGGAGIGIFSDSGATVSWNTATNNNVMSYYETPGGIVVGALNASGILVAHNASGNAAGTPASQMFGVQVLDSQDANSSNVAIAQDNLLSGNLAAAISSPQGSYAQPSDSALPAMTYPVPVNDAPTISGVPATVATTSAAAIMPFASASITSTEMGVTEALTITLSGGDAVGRLSGNGVVETSTPGIYTIDALSGTPAAATAALQSVVFTPMPGVPKAGTSVAAALSVTDVQTSPTSNATVSSSASSTVTVTSVGPAPITATPSSHAATTNDATPVQPFANVVISDPNPGQLETAMVTSGSAANGVLSDPNGGSDGSVLNDGTYAVTGTAAAVAADLDALVFTPTRHQVAPGQTIGTTINATISDTAGQQTGISSTVVATAVNDPPVIAGLESDLTTAPGAVFQPFATASITDPDSGSAVALMITVANDAGAASDASGQLSGAGLIKIGAGSYVLAAATPAALSSELQGLTFTAVGAGSGQSVDANIILTASQTADATTTDVSATIGLSVSASNVVKGPASGSAVLVGNGGSDTIIASGTSNTIDTNGGSGMINAGQGGATVNAGAGSQSIALGGGSNTVIGGDGSDTVIGAPDGATAIQLGNGNDFIDLGGEGNTIQLGNGNDTVVDLQGMAFIATGGGDDTIEVSGADNTIIAGSGVTAIFGAATGTTFVLPQAGSGLALLLSFNSAAGDVLDLHSALQATGWNGQASTLGNYVSVTDAGSVATVSIKPGGSGAGVVVADVYGSPGISLAGLVSTQSVITGPAA